MDPVAFPLEALPSDLELLQAQHTHLEVVPSDSEGEESGGEDDSTVPQHGSSRSEVLESVRRQVSGGAERATVRGRWHPSTVDVLPL